MKKKPSFLQRVMKYKKLLVLVGFVMLLLIVSYIIWGLQVRFILEEELDMTLTPVEKSFSIPYDEYAEVTFDLVVDHPLVCDVRCESQLIDVSLGELLDQQVTTKDKVSYSYALSVDEVGEGQHVYSYQVVCHNVRSSLCNSNEKKYFKSAIITLNYELPEKEQEAKVAVAELLPGYLNDSAAVESIVKTIENLSLQLNIPLSAQVVSLEAERQEEKEKILGAWSRQQYGVAFGLLTSSVKYNFPANTYLAEAEYKYVHDLMRATSISQERLLAFSESSFLAQTDRLLQNTSSYQNFVDFVNQTQTVMNAYNNTDFTSAKEYEQFIASVDELEEMYEGFSPSVVLQEQREKTQLVSVLSKQQFLYDQVGIDHAVELSNVSCEVLTTESFMVRRENNATAQQQNLILINDSFWQTYSSDYQKFLEAKYVTPSLSFNFSFYRISNHLTLADIPDANELVFVSAPSLSSCQRTSNRSISGTFQPSEYNSEVYVDSEPFTVVVPEPICCHDGDCRSCCTQETCRDLYPVVFVHGHALSEGNAPEESHAAFGKIQRRLESEGYVTAGQLGEGSFFDIPQGDWGRIPAPMSVRLSYYLITYIDVGSYQIVSQKTDKIENYAIRLKELIDTVKYRTGKDKVDIVAHSMGGLVTREYIALFGEESVNKFIMVGTPNGGVSGRVGKFCSVIGASRECEDMREGSIFLKRLNVPRNEFETIDAYVLIGSGCDMDGKDGDGIVLAESAALPYTTNIIIEGECTDALNSNLHIDMMDPDKYPKTYEVIRGILLGEE